MKTLKKFYVEIFKPSQTTAFLSPCIEFHKTSANNYFLVYSLNFFKTLLNG